VGWTPRIPGQGGKEKEKGSHEATVGGVGGGVKVRGQNSVTLLPAKGNGQLTSGWGKQRWLKKRGKKEERHSLPNKMKGRKRKGAAWFEKPNVITKIGVDVCIPVREKGDWKRIVSG